MSHHLNANTSILPSKSASSTTAQRLPNKYSRDSHSNIITFPKNPTEAQLTAYFTLPNLSSASTLFLFWYRLTTNLPGRNIAAFHNEIFTSSISTNPITRTSHATEWTVADAFLHGSAVVVSGLLGRATLQPPNTSTRCPCHFGIDCTQEGLKKRRERGRNQKNDLVLAARIWRADSDWELLACPEGWTWEKPKPGAIRLDDWGNRVPPALSGLSRWWRWLGNEVYNAISSVVVSSPRVIASILLLATIYFLPRFFVSLVVAQSWWPSPLFTGAASRVSSPVDASLQGMEEWIAETGGKESWIWGRTVLVFYIIGLWTLICGATVGVVVVMTGHWGWFLGREKRRGRSGDGGCQHDEDEDAADDDT